MKKIIIIIVVLLISIPTVVMAEDRSPSKDLLDEIDIMEAVLNRLISKSNGEMTFQGSNARGFYLSDYGVIFNVSYYNVPGLVITGPSDDSSENTNFLYSYYKSESDPERKDAIPEIKKSINTFFTKYASSLTGLKPDEKITIILDLNRLPFARSYQKNESPCQVTATVSVKDILDFQENKISVNELEKHLIFNELRTPDDEVSIFSDVIQTSLKNMKGNLIPGFSGNVKSAYLPGHGIVFMTDVDMGMTFSLIRRNIDNISGKIGQLNNQVIIGGRFTDKDRKNEPEIKEDDYKEYEDKMVNIISKYGHTLSKINPDEWVEIALNLDRVGMDKRFSKDLIKVKKGDIDDFNRGKIDFDSFRKKVRVIHY